MGPFARETFAQGEDQRPVHAYLDGRRCHYHQPDRRLQHNYLNGATLSAGRSSETAHSSDTCRPPSPWQTYRVTMGTLYARLLLVPLYVQPTQHQTCRETRNLF